MTLAITTVLGWPDFVIIALIVVLAHVIVHK